MADAAATHAAYGPAALGAGDVAAPAAPGGAGAGGATLPAMFTTRVHAGGVVSGPGGNMMIRAETAAAAELTKDVSEHGRKVARIVQRIVSSRKGLSRPQVVVGSEAGAGGEAKFVMPLLVEDRAGNGTHSYVEYLRHVHKRVMDKMANDSAQSDMQTWEMLNHGY